MVPGKWSAADFRYQAEHIVTSKLNNAGHNCIATQVLLLPSQWDGSDRLLDEIRHLLGSLPPRPDYYPGANQRLADILRAHPDAESYAGAAAAAACSSPTSPTTRTRCCDRKPSPARSAWSASPEPTRGPS